jgi:hypothetical protein
VCVEKGESSESESKDARMRMRTGRRIQCQLKRRRKRMNENDDAHIHFGHKTQAEEQTTSLFNNEHPESRECLEEEKIHHNPLLVQDGCAYCRHVFPPCPYAFVLGRSGLERPCSSVNS